jgi:Right handed beta helix region
MRFCMFILLMLVPMMSGAAVWHVEKDGTGDFAVIQDAVDAAADGDTIQIGPGRFNEGESYTIGSFTEFYRVVVDKENLSIIGAGGGQTIIGSIYPWTLESGFNRGIVCGPYYGSDTISISGIRFENMGTGIKVDSCSSVLIVNCDFVSNAQSVSAYFGNLVVSRCSFEFNERDYYHILSYGQESIAVQDCRFELDRSLNWLQTHIHHEGSESSRITGCEFVGGDAGIVSSSSTPIETNNCQLSEITYGAFISSSGSFQAIRDCSVSQSKYAFVSYSSLGNWNVERVTVTDAVASTLHYRDPILGYMRDNNFSKGPQFVAERRSEFEKPESHFDMTNNWWGTTDPDSIAAWILDANDLPVTGQIIDFVPFKQQPVKTDQKSWGQMKNMFR